MAGVWIRGVTGHVFAWRSCRVAMKPKKPKVVCVSGSTRFIGWMAIAMWELEKKGVIALGCHLLPAFYGAAAHHQAEAEGVAAAMDELHRRKIDLADSLLVVTVGGYIGQSTREEIQYANALGKPVEYLECGE